MPSLSFLSSSRPNPHHLSLLVIFVITEEWHGLIGSHPKPPNFRFRCIPNVIHSELGRAADCPSLIEAVETKMEGPYEPLLDRLHPPPPTLILADAELSWAVRVGNRRNIPVASLWTSFYHFHLLPQNQIPHFPAADLSEVGAHRLDYIPGISSILMVGLPTVFHERDSALKSIKLLPKTQYLLFTSAQELEPHFLTPLKSEFQLPVYPVGRLIRYLHPTPNTRTIPIVEKQHLRLPMSRFPAHSLCVVLVIMKLSLGF